MGFFKRIGMGFRLFFKKIRRIFRRPAKAIANFFKRIFDIRDKVIPEPVTYEKDEIARDDILKKLRYIEQNMTPGAPVEYVELDGKWGSGKTFVKNQFMNELRETHPDSYVIIDYNACENSGYKDPLVAILYCIYDGFQNFCERNEIKPKRSRKIRKQVGKIMKHFDFRQALVCVLEKFEHYPDFRVAVAVFVVRTILNCINTSNKILGNEHVKDEILENEHVKEYVSYINLIKQVVDLLNGFTEIRVKKLLSKRQIRKRLKHVQSRQEQSRVEEAGTEQAKAGQQKTLQPKIIIFMDELDRCQPDVQMAILERLYNLRGIKNCLVICTVNEDQIIKAYKKMYGDDAGEDAYNYFKKFFTLPPIHMDMSNEKYFKAHLKEMLNKFPEFKLCDSEKHLGWLQRVVFDMVAAGNVDRKTISEKTALHIQFDNLNSKIKEYERPDKTEDYNKIYAELVKVMDDLNEHSKLVEEKLNTVLDNREIHRTLESVKMVLKRIKFKEGVSQEFRDAYLTIIIYICFSKVYYDRLYQAISKADISDSFYYDLAEDSHIDELKYKINPIDLERPTVCISTRPDDIKVNSADNVKESEDSSAETIDVNKARNKKGVRREYLNWKELDIANEFINIWLGVRKVDDSFTKIYMRLVYTGSEEYIKSYNPRHLTKTVYEEKGAMEAYDQMKTIFEAVEECIPGNRVAGKDSAAT